MKVAILTNIRKTIEFLTIPLIGALAIWGIDGTEWVAATAAVLISGLVYAEFVMTKLGKK